ncbi:GC-rich sequence DNA-binding factor domain-containing protein [Artemisia annua]|uniref:GC-rich sequence DNA-binding factor domain-containing protein n=1 Tax=Artemisia annua TaxID=35608 RepID=A0A2U1Q5X6_ARTAN|nr:GC-rich sequence DNA-binding factor domain-containing protein [Artemisia annua]
MWHQTVATILQVCFLRNDEGNQEMEISRESVAMKLLENMGIKDKVSLLQLKGKVRPKNLGLRFKDYKENANVPTMQELLEGGRIFLQLNWICWQRSKNMDVVQNVIDMREPEVRALVDLDNMDNMNAEEKSWENDIPMPELQHNVNVFVHSVELDIQKVDQDFTNKRMTAQNEIVTVLYRLDNEIRLRTLTLDLLIDLFGNLKKWLPMSTITVRHELKVNLVDHNVDQFCWVKTWASVIPIHHWYMAWMGLILTELLSSEHMWVFGYWWCPLTTMHFQYHEQLTMEKFQQLFSLVCHLILFCHSFNTFTKPSSYSLASRQSISGLQKVMVSVWLALRIW